MCIICNKSFSTNQTNKKVCSLECRKIHKRNTERNRHKPKEKTTRNCANCNKEYVSNRSDSKHCSKKCSREYTGWKKQTYEKVCPICDTKFTTTKQRYIYCCKECNNKSMIIKQRFRNSGRGAYETCKWCNKEYMPFKFAGGGVCYCSKKCRRKAGHHNVRSKRRLRMKNNGEYNCIHLAEILKRDDYLCQICKKPVNMEVDFPHPEYPTIDHIIPLCKGGHHSYSNVQLTHWCCNFEKYTDIIDNGELNMGKIPNTVHECFNKLQNNIVELTNIHTVFTEFYCNSKERVDFLNQIDAGFFGIFQNICADKIISIFNYIADPSQQGKYKNLCLQQLIDVIELSGNKSLAHELFLDLNEIKKIINPMLEHRNKRISHQDYDVAMGVTVLPNITIKIMKDALNNIHKFMNRVSLHYYDADLMFIPSPLCNGRSLLFSLSQAKAYDELEKNYKVPSINEII